MLLAPTGPGHFEISMSSRFQFGQITAYSTKIIWICPSSIQTPIRQADAAFLSNWCIVLYHRKKNKKSFILKIAYKHNGFYTQFCGF
jgi:hypothetical protein